MPPPVNYSETIIGLLVTALESINTNSNEYNNDLNVSGILRYDREKSPSVSPAVVISRGPENWVEDGSSWQATYSFRLELYAKETDQRSTDEQVALLEADVKKAIVSQSFDGHEGQLQSISSTPFYSNDIEETAEGCFLDVVFTARLDFSNPEISTGSLI